MNLRLLTLTAACAAALATTLIANPQDPAAKDCTGNGPNHRHWGALEHMTKTLDLTADQQAKIRPILEQARPQITVIWQDARQEMKAIRDNAKSQIRPLLTPAQQTKLDAIQKEHDPAANNSSGNSPRHRHWGNALEHMTKALDLTPDQEAKIRPILEQARPQIRSIWQDARQKMKAIRDNTMPQIRPLLTPVQQTKLDAIQKAREDMRKAREEMREAAKP